MTPVSLLATISGDQRHLAAVAVAASSRSRRWPSRADAIPAGIELIDAAGCEVAARHAPRHVPGRDDGSIAAAAPPCSSRFRLSASALASEPPEVKITLRGSAPTAAATCSRASSTSRRTAAALAMDRRRVPDHIHGREHGGARLRAQRRGRIPVEIDPVRHGVRLQCRRRQLPIVAGVAPHAPLKYLLFVPALVLKAPAATAWHRIAPSIVRSRLAKN